MLNQSKTAHQAEIDAVCEMIDFWRFNAEYVTRIYSEQPYSPTGTWNRMEYRPLEGFVFAVSPFNFTCIGGNLSTLARADGEHGRLEAGLDRRALRVLPHAAAAGGRPPGRRRSTSCTAPARRSASAALASPELAGIHFTGSTEVFNGMWETVGANVGSYRNYPRIVGETGGKDFILAHPSAEAEAVATAIVRGSFEYQGQKCSAASRALHPVEHLAGGEGAARRGRRHDQDGRRRGLRELHGRGHRLGGVRDALARRSPRRAPPAPRSSTGGETDDSEGYFVEPTVIATDDKGFRLLRDELFGPIVTTYVYDEKRWDDTLELVDETAPYGLTGAVFATERSAIDEAQDALRYAAGNFYVNDKPTGAVVGQQPFGGSRASGTNDKAGSMWNLIRWVSPRTVKETFVPPTDYRYPFLGPDGDRPS